MGASPRRARRCTFSRECGQEECQGDLPVCVRFCVTGALPRCWHPVIHARFSRL